MELQTKAVKNAVMAGNATSVAMTVVGCCLGWSLLKGVIIITAATTVVGVGVGLTTAMVDSKTEVNA